MLKRFAAIAITALVLTGCAAFAQIQNPLDSTDVYRAKNTYAIALQASVDYRAYCYSKPFRAILADPIMKPVCQYRRRVITAFQKARPPAAAALDRAEKFIVENPTVSPAELIKLALDAVGGLRDIIPLLPGR